MGVGTHDVEGKFIKTLSVNSPEGVVFDVLEDEEAVDVLTESNLAGKSVYAPNLVSPKGEKYFKTISIVSGGACGIIVTNI